MISFILLLLNGLSTQAYAQPAQTCVASFLGTHNNEKVLQETYSLLEKMGYLHPAEQLVFKQATSVKSIRECLEGDFEDVTLLMHSSELVQGHQSLVFLDEQNQWRILNSIIFKNIIPNPKLRQITLITCESKKVLSEYQTLVQFAQKHQLHIRLQSSSLLVLALTGIDARTNFGQMFAKTLAESAQDLEAEKVFCNIPTSLFALYEHESADVTCLRSHYEVKFHGLISAGIKSSHRWMWFDRPDTNESSSSRFGFLDFEIGLFKGLNANLSLDPGAVTSESYGFSFSPMTYATVTKIGSKSFLVD